MLPIPEFSSTVRRYFNNPQKFRQLERWDAEGRIVRHGGIQMVIQLVLDSGRIANSRFMAYGCVPAIAAASFTAEWACGRRLDEARALTPSSLEDMLEGLPDDRRHCAEHAVDTLRAALDNALRARTEDAR